MRTFEHVAALRGGDGEWQRRRRAVRWRRHARGINSDAHALMRSEVRRPSAWRAYTAMRSMRRWRRCVRSMCTFERGGDMSAAPAKNSRGDAPDSF